MKNYKGSSTKRKLISYLLKRDPTLTNQSIPTILNDIKRFVEVVQRIYTEPQAQITIKDVKENGIIVRKKIITTDLEEVKKVFDKNRKTQDLAETMRKFRKLVTKDKYGR